MKKLTFLLLISLTSILSGFTPTTASLYPDLDKLFVSTKKKFKSISTQREAELAKISQLIAKKKSKSNAVTLVFVSKNNSGADQVAQAILQAATSYYGIAGIKSFSVGQSPATVDSRIVEQLVKSGFKNSTSGSKVELKYNDQESIALYSKGLDDSSLPQSEFYSVITCAGGKTNCNALKNSEYTIEVEFPDFSDLKDNAEFEKEFTRIVTEMAFVIYMVKETHVK